jgi:hypothetical protein
MSNTIAAVIYATSTDISTKGNSSNRNEDYNDQTTESKSQLPIAEAIAGITVFGSLALVAPFVLGYARTPLPYMATPASKVNRALSFVKNRNKSNLYQKNRSNSLHFLDLGSGDGEAVYQAAKLGFHKSVGIELNWTLYIVCQFRRNFCWTFDERNRTTFYCRDFFKSNPALISNSNAVMIFGVPSLMQNISRMLARHCLPGTFILAYRFPLPLGDPTFPVAPIDESDTLHDNAMREHSTEAQINKSSLVRANLIYDEEGMRVYECE